MCNVYNVNNAYDVYSSYNVYELWNVYKGHSVYIVHIAYPYLSTYLLQVHGVIPCLKLYHVPERFNQVSYYITGGRAVLPGGQSMFGDFQPRLIYLQAGDSLPR